jgi:O-acetylhomoserine/O-acetylserine sulfhydrylase-like pyridoxal-dependent enzyme
MNILLQNKKTSRYVTDLSTWTMQHEKAHLFGTGIEALFFCFNRHLKNMQILGEFLNPRKNFTMPVTNLRGD